MGISDWAPILVAIIAALGAWAAQRAASKASKVNTEVSGKLQAEKDAYERARAFDTETIERQDRELRELREENRALKEELGTVKKRLAHLENSKIPELERELHDRLQDPTD